MTIEQWLGKDNKLGIDIWEKKYRFNNESFDEWLDRVSSGNLELRKLIKEKKFLFGGRILANINTGTQQGVSNCTTLGFVKDDLNDIMDTAKNLALSYKSEAGVGIALSKIRPKGAKIGQKGVSDGIIGFLKIFNAVTENISRGNQRRGAMLVGLHAEHPDVMDFINIKKSNSGSTGMITSANLSVLVTDEFMENYKNKTSYRHDFVVEDTGEIFEHTVDPVAIMNAIVDTPNTAFEPGILFVDRYKEQHLFGNVYGDMELFNNACHTYDSLLLTDKGYIKIGELAENKQTVNAWNGFKFSEVSPFKTSDSEKIYEVVFSDGSVNMVTGYHKFHLNTGIKRTHELKIGDELVKFNLPALDSIVEYRDISLSVVSITEMKEKQATYCATEHKNHTLVVNGVMSGNCSEFIGVKGTICLLASMNLLEYVKPCKFEDGRHIFDYEEFNKDVNTVIRAMDNAHEYGIGRNGLDIQNERARDYRGLGLGITGLGDMFMKLGIKYGSEESIIISREIASTMRKVAIQTSLDLGKELGQPYGILEDERKMTELGLEYTKGLRNNSLLSIAPAGSISSMLGISSGIEPVFRTSYRRKTESLNDVDTYYDIYHKPIQDIIDRVGYKPDYCIDTRDVTAKEKIDVISTWQEFVDLSISNTTNFAKGTQVEEIRDAYVYAWEKGVKGLTMYVDGSIDGVLNDIKENEDTANHEDVVERGIMAKVPEDTIYYPREMNHGCGKAKVMVGYSPSENRITDVYHIEKGMGGCSKNTQGEAILISQVLRLGGNLEDIKKSFSGIGACTSCTVSRMKGNKVDGMNCPNILLKIVLDANNELVDKNKPVINKVKEKNVSINKEDIPIAIADKLCPICNTPLSFNSGCHTCLECGYSKCD